MDVSPQSLSKTSSECSPQETRRSIGLISQKCKDVSPDISLSAERGDLVSLLWFLFSWCFHLKMESAPSGHQSSSSRRMLLPS